MLTRRVASRLIVLFLGVWLTPYFVPDSSHVRAQITTATLSGTVVDQTGAVVSDVKVVVMNTGNGLERRAVSGEDGYFIAPLLPPGTYTLTAEMPGFATVTMNDIEVQSGMNCSVQIRLWPKELRESMDVPADASAGSSGIQVDISNATLKYSVSSSEIALLPIWTTAFGRNGLGLLPFLAPGITPTSIAGSADPSANRLGNQMSINGSRPVSINFNIEGGDNNDHELNRASSPLPNPDALQEFTVVAGNYQADHGRSSGGIIDAVIKSGTRRYRGNARYIYINDALNARGFFDAAVPNERLNVVGGQLGGPLPVPPFLKSEQPFFFVDYEGTKYTRDRSATMRVLTEGERIGDFSKLPQDLWPHNPVTGKTFKGGIVPSTFIDANARRYVRTYIPVPNKDGGLLNLLLRTQSQSDQFNSRLDQKLGSSDSLSAVFLFGSSDIQDDQLAFPLGTMNATRSATKNLVLRETHVFSTTSVNQAAFALNHIGSNSEVNAPGFSGINPKEFGFPGVHPQTTMFLSAPSVTFGDIQIGTGTPMVMIRSTWQVKDDLSLVRGNHSLKIGEEAWGFHQSSVVGNNNGAFQFSGFYTKNPVSDFLIGLPWRYTQTTGSSIQPRQNAYYFYGMDDWRVKSNLTINLGLRYELAPPPTDRLDQVTAFRPGYTSRRFPHAPVGLLFAGDPDPILGAVPREVYPADKNNFAPRIGVAFSPKPGHGWLHTVFGDEKTAIRAGLGVFYDQTLGRSFTTFSFVQPFSISQSLDYTQIRQVSGTFANPFGTSENPWPLDLSQRLFAGTPTVHTIDPHFRTAYSYQYNITLERELPWSVLFQIAYVGSLSQKLNRERELNPYAIDETTAFYNRVFPTLGNVGWQESSGRSRYDALQLRISRRYRNGLTVDGSYVFAKALDNASDPASSFTTDPFRWARSSYDRTHNVVVTYTYTVPELSVNRLVGQIVNGWQVGGVTELRSGMPMDIRESVIGSTGRFAGNPDIVGPYTKLDPRRYQTITINGVTRTGNFFFDPSAFREVTDFTKNGTLGRNVFDGPGMNLTSVSLVKRFAFTESQKLELRCDVRNLFNHAHFQAPFLTSPNSLSFGQVSSAAPGRNVQMSVKYNF
ncbi:MAG TPA: carboxypeptidase-like regulatory domain-containing protein [Blastocatellia bacterium]|nr:carboxypeptidase-like regulatory domain-containing protein [Blastocatellia bacterium]